MSEQKNKTKYNKARFNQIYDIKFNPASNIYKEAGQDLNKTIFVIFGSFISTALLFKEEFRQSVTDNYWVSLAMIAGLFITVILFFIHKMLQMYKSKNIMRALDGVNDKALANWQDKYVKEIEDIEPYEQQMPHILNFTCTLFFYYASFLITFIFVAIFVISNI